MRRAAVHVREHTHHITLNSRLQVVATKQKTASPQRPAWRVSAAGGCSAYTVALLASSCTVRHHQRSCVWHLEQRLAQWHE